MADEIPLNTRSLRLEITVPCDDRFRPVLSLLCQRMARYVGYPEADASEVAGTVVHATDGVLTHDDAPPYSSLDVTIATTDEEIEFHVRYLRDESDTSEPPGIRQLLSTTTGSESPLEIMERVMRRVAFGRADGVEYCTLTKALPEESPR